MRRIAQVAVLASLAGFAQAQTNFAAASTAAPWLKLAPSARMAALADAGSALKGELDARSLNPASLAGLQGHQISLMHNLHVQDSSTEHLGYGLGLWDGAGLAISGDYVNFGAVETYKVVNNALVKEGSINPFAWTAALGFGQSVGGLSLGANAKMLSQDLGGSVSNAFAGDFGLQYELKADAWSMGLAASYLNVGTTLDGASLPQGLKLGLRSSGDLGIGDLTLLGDINALATEGGFGSGSLGAEFMGKQLYALRGGYKFLNNGGAGGLTVGAGLRFSAFNVDYALVMRDQLGASNQFSLGAKF